MRSFRIGGHHLGQKMWPYYEVERWPRNGFLKYYSDSDAIGTKVSVRHRRSGRSSVMVVKRGSTVYL